MANTAYNRGKRAEYRQAARDDELAAKRLARNEILTASIAKQWESGDSVASGCRTIGEMERAVIEERATMNDPNPTLVVAAMNLGRLVDELTGEKKVALVHISALKQLMSTMAEMRGDKAASKATGRRKSGGRLATVGALTKVQRAR